MPTRRQIQFQSYDDILADVDKLLRGGYERGGQWSLGMASEHLAITIKMAFDPAAKGMPRLIRPVIRWVILPRILKKGMPKGMKGLQAIMPSATVTDEAGRDVLRQAIEVAKANTHAKLDHPIFGTIESPVFDRLQRVHAQHHLSFLIPK